MNPARKKRPAWRPTIDPGASTPLYIAIANQLAADVASGKLEPYARLPTHRDLAWTLGCTIGTITRAYAEAERRGLVHGEVGRGTYVRPPAIPYADPIVARSVVNPTGDPRAVMDAAPARLIDLAMNWPAEVGEDELLRRTLADIAKMNDINSLLEFSGRAGLERHRAAGARLLARRQHPSPARGKAAAAPAIDPAHVLISAGTQHALMVTLAALTAPGDAVLVEDLTYPGVVSLARLMRLRLKSIACDGDGPLPGAFEAACRVGDARAFYMTPVQHNPTGRTISEARRRALARVAEMHELPIIEDDVYGFFPTDAPPPIAAFAPEHVIHLAGLSKIGAPGLRIGFLRAPPRLAARLAAAMAAASWTAAPIAAEVATRWIDEGVLDEILRRKREEARRRYDIAAPIFRNAGVPVRAASAQEAPATAAHAAGGGGARAQRPAVRIVTANERGSASESRRRLAEASANHLAAMKGDAPPAPAPTVAAHSDGWSGTHHRTGMASREAAPQKAELILPADCFHAWLKLPDPWRARDFASEAEAQGVRLTPADAFLGGRTDAPSAVRLCLGNAKTHADLKRALQVVAQLLAMPLAAAREVV
ncbi:PLP-dependent aminotransferase family protein [Vineibacter terrae]|uniref:PLP-dependent aminotransferase family protein n=1 Tax=Vineibacter terrae TaxID=2586908 RepID=A0A5C8PAG1_9HYPH|nr:PLP-dependent aminotransferase family protein [Vineibacter terrae]TXL70012.1 PLP-dependent aminotransferase family protein [Vineibacter terrae]